MKKLIDTRRRSFSARLSLWVVSFAALVFLGAMAYFFTVSRRYVREEAILRATQVVENSVLRLNNILEDVQLSADNLEWLVYRHLDEPELMKEYSRITVQGNPVLSGCSISFEDVCSGSCIFFSSSFSSLVSSSSIARYLFRNLNRQ